MTNDAKYVHPLKLSLKNERCRCHCSQVFIVWVKSPQCFVLNSFPLSKSQPQEAAMCMNPFLRTTPLTTPSLSASLSLPPRTPPGHSVRHTPPLHPLTTERAPCMYSLMGGWLGKRGRRYAGERAWGEKAYCTMLRGDTP